MFREYSLKLKTPPIIEPMQLEDAKDHLRVSGNNQDALIMGLLKAAREQVEYDTGLSLASQTYEMYLDEFPSGNIELTHGPVQSITSIKYYDAANVLQTLSASLYDTDLVRNPARVAPVTEWPTSYTRLNSVKVEYVAGYASAILIPDKYKQAIKLLVYHWYNNPSSVVTGTIASELPKGYDMLVRDHVRGI